MRSVALLLSVSLLAGLSSSQVVYTQPKYRSGDTLLAESLAIPVVSLPLTINNAELAAQETERAFNDISFGEYRFGTAYHVDVSLESGAWYALTHDIMLIILCRYEEGNISVWRMAIESPRALSLNLIFDQFQLALGAELYILTNQAVFGPYTHLNNKQHQGFASWPIAANRLVLEYYAPTSLQLPLLRISRIIHGFRNWEESAAAKKSGRCNVDVACQLQDWYKQTQSVAMLLTDAGTGFCSGAMLNNLRNDGRQLFLTAFHCVGYKNVTNDMLLFNYQVSSCRSNQTAPRHQTAHGIVKLSQWRDSDFALLELEEQIPEDYNVHLAGWSAEPLSPKWTVGIHHPSADTKKISLYNGTCADACWGWCNEDADQLDHWKVPAWTIGTTEPGSSGSPLFDGPARRVIGQLHGGSASCRNRAGYDMYGKLHYSFDKASGDNQQLKPFLDPDQTGKLSVDGIDLSTSRIRHRFVYQH
jgi:hypothetical protein